MESSSKLFTASSNSLLWQRETEDGGVTVEDHGGEIWRPSDTGPLHGLTRVYLMLLEINT